MQAKQPRTRGWPIWLTLPCAIALDRFTKAAAASLTAPRVLIPGVLGLRYAQNTGMAFSLLAGRSWLLGLLTLAILAAGGLFLRRFRLGALPRFGALLVLSGGLSNAWDRFFAGYVTDMLELLFVRFAIFNVADVCVCTGAALCALSLLARPRDWQERGGDGRG